MVLGNILVIDPKSTSTKIAVFENSKMSFLTTIRHNMHDLAESKTEEETGTTGEADKILAVTETGEIVEEIFGTNNADDISEA